MSSYYISPRVAPTHLKLCLLLVLNLTHSRVCLAERWVFLHTLVCKKKQIFYAETQYSLSAVYTCMHAVIIFADLINDILTTMIVMHSTIYLLTLWSKYLQTSKKKLRYHMHEWINNAEICDNLKNCLKTYSAWLQL